MPNKNISNQGITKKNNNKTEWVGKGERRMRDREREEEARYTLKGRRKN